MPIKEHPELSYKYPAIDGIARKECLRVKEPIRSDIESIISLDDNEFNKWYFECKNAGDKLLEMYESFGNIPDLRVYLEGDYFNMSTCPPIANIIETLKRGLDYLEKIKQAREEYQKPKS